MHGNYDPWPYIFSPTWIFVPLQLIINSMQHSGTVSLDSHASVTHAANFIQAVKANKINLVWSVGPYFSMASPILYGPIQKLGITTLKLL